MFEDISKKEIFIVISALLFGFGLVRWMLTPKHDGKTSNGEHPYDFDEKKESDKWFDILEVESTASLDEIKSAYKKKISQYHPDKVSALGPEFTPIAEQKTKQINVAYEKAVRKFQ